MVKVWNKKVGFERWINGDSGKNTHIFLWMLVWEKKQIKNWLKRSIRYQLVTNYKTMKKNHEKEKKNLGNFSWVDNSGWNFQRQSE